ncbi:hypothetical protein ON010_g8866 [Phytophthora cinnamomi]|nr:hypothetical protein ON010_g8866 [Phytophthora cinnamomi]
MRSSRGPNTAITRSDASALASTTICSSASRDIVTSESSVVEQPASALEVEHRAASCDNWIATESPAALPTSTSTREVSCKTRDEDNNLEGKRRQLKIKEQVNETGEVASDADDSAGTSGEAWRGVSPPASELNPGDNRTTWEADAQSHQASASHVKVTESEKTTGSTPWPNWPSTQQRSHTRTHALH